MHFIRDIGNMRIIDTVQVYSFQFQRNILMHHRFCYEMRMSRLVTRIVTLEFVALLAACGKVRTSGVRNTSKTFSTVVVDAGRRGYLSGAFRIAATGSL